MTPKPGKNVKIETIINEAFRAMVKRPWFNSILTDVRARTFNICIETREKTGTRCVITH